VLFVCTENKICVRYPGVSTMCQRRSYQSSICCLSVLQEIYSRCLSLRKSHLCDSVYFMLFICLVIGLLYVLCDIN